MKETEINNWVSGQTCEGVVGHGEFHERFLVSRRLVRVILERLFTVRFLDLLRAGVITHLWITKTD